MDTNKNMVLLSQAPVPKALIKLGIPTMVGMMVSSLYNLVDAYFVGRLGTSQQAAVAAVFPVGLVMLGVGLLFGSGAGSYLSRLLGNGDKKKADECASTALALAVLSAIAFVGIMLAGINPLLRLLGCTETMLPYAREYAIPFIMGLIVNVVNVTLSNLTTNEGAPIYSMRAMLLGGLGNIILDPLLIFVFHMGVFGAAIATLLSRLLSLSSYLLYLFQKKSSLDYSLKNVHIEKKLLIQIAKIGIPTCIFQILCSVALSITNNLAAPYGDAAIAALGIVNRITTFGYMTIMGFLKGYQTFVGFNYGAKNYKRMQDATKTMLLWTSCFCLLASGTMFLFRVPLIQAFSKNDPLLVSIGVKVLVLQACVFLTAGFQYVFTTKFLGMGKGMEGSLVSLGRQGFFFIPIVYIFTANWGLNGLILAQPVADFLSFALIGILAFRNKKKEESLYLSAVL